MNKTLICVIAFALVAVLAATSEQETLRSFMSYIRKHGKKYGTPDEFNLRYQNYRASVARIAEKNSKSTTARYALNKFSDMTPAEFKSKILMKNPIRVNSKPKDPSRVLPINPDLAVPNQFDWRAKGAVTAVKNQEQCGSCWAFSATENIESMWILAGKSNNETLNLSPQQIVDCDSSDDGCDGGDTPTAYEYVISAGGMDPLADYPYTAEDGNCKFSQSEVAASISNWKYASETDNEQEIQKNLVAWGPLSICVDAEYWQDYSSGVMTWSECAWINELDHCVQMVGYNAKASTPYWIVRNSWGTDWGVEGYIYLQMWEDTCGLTHEATCSVV